MAELELMIEYPNQNWFPADINIGQLEAVMQEAFRRRDMAVVPEYFVKGSEFAPQNLLYFVFGRGKNGGKNVEGGVVATGENIDGRDVAYLCKVFMGDAYSGNGEMKEMFPFAISHAHDNLRVPVMWRTSDHGLSQFYARYSDTPTIEVNGFYVQGAGFFDKATGRELFEGASQLFDKGAYKIGYKKRTVLPLKPEASAAAPAGTHYTAAA